MLWILTSTFLAHMKTCMDLTHTLVHFVFQTQASESQTASNAIKAPRGHRLLMTAIANRMSAANNPDTSMTSSNEGIVAATVRMFQSAPGANHQPVPPSEHGSIRVRVKPRAPTISPRDLFMASDEHETTVNVEVNPRMDSVGIEKQYSFAAKELPEIPTHFPAVVPDVEASLAMPNSNESSRADQSGRLRPHPQACV